MMGYPDYGLHPQFTIGPITVGSQQSVPITTHTVTGGGNTLTPQTVTGGGGTLTPRTVTGGPTFTPVTPRTVTPVTPRTVTPITPGTFPTFRAAGLDDYGGLGGYGGYGYGGYDDLSGVAPQFTIGPITVGSQQSVPITTHTVTGGGNTLTPQTVTGGGGTLTPRTVTGGPTFTPVTPRTVTPVTPRTVTPITPGTFPTFRAAGLDDYGGLGGYGGYGYGGYDDLGGVAPQFTIGPITVGSQQSVPITTHTVTGGGNTLTPQTVTGGGGTLTPRTVTGGPTFTPVTPRTVTPVTPRTVTPITPGTFPTFRAAGLDDYGGLGGYGGYGYGGYDDLSGVAPQFTIGPITVGSQQSVPITTHTVTGGGNTLTPQTVTGGGGTLTPRTVTGGPAFTPVTPRTVTPVTPRTVTPITPGTFPTFRAAGLDDYGGLGGYGGYGYGGYDDLSGVAPQFTIGPITVGSQQSVPITTHTVTGGGNTLTPQTVTGGGGTLTPRTVTGGPTFTPVTPRTVTPVTPRTVTPITPGTFPTFRAAGLDDYGGLGGYGGYGYGGYDDLSGVAPQFTIGPITVGSQQSVPITTHTVTGGGNTLTPQTVTGGGGTLTPRTVTGGPTFTPVTPRTVTPVTPRTVTPITPGTFPTFRAAGLDDLGGLDPYGAYGGYGGYGGYDDLSGVAPQATLPTLPQTTPQFGYGPAPQFTIGPITVGSRQSLPFTQTVSVTPGTFTPGFSLNTFGITR